MTTEKTALLPVSADEAFALITDPDRLRRWQVVSARVDLRAGGAYRWTVIPGHVAAGTFTEVEPGRRIVFGWGWEGSTDLPPDASTVTITVEPADGGTLVRLVHDGLTEAQAASHLEGWTHYFERLALAAAAGDAGPDEWAAMPEPLDQLTSAGATLAVCQQALRGITVDDLGKTTPCSEFTVGQLVDHLVESLVRLGAMAGTTVVPPAHGTPESRVATVTQQVLEAWARRGLDGTVPYGEAELPAPYAASILSLEFLIHGWDLATATAQQITVADALTTYVLELAGDVISPENRARGAFAEAIETGPDAHPLARLIAFSGRVPA